MNTLTCDHLNSYRLNEVTEKNLLFIKLQRKLYIQGLSDKYLTSPPEGATIAR